MPSGAIPEPPPPDAPLPPPDRPESSDERPQASTFVRARVRVAGQADSTDQAAPPAFVRARARVVQKAGPKGPSFQKVAGRSPGAPPPQESTRAPRVALPNALPEVNASLDHHGSVLDPLVAGQGPGLVARPPSPSFPRARAALHRHGVLLVAVSVVLLGLAIAGGRVLRAGRVATSSVVAPSGG